VKGESQGPLGHLDEPRDGQRGAGRVLVRGWVIGAGKDVVRIRAVVDGASTNLGLRFVRPDVARSRPGAAAALAGFEGWVSLGASSGGQLAVIADLADGSTYLVGERALGTDASASLAHPRVLVWGRSLDQGGSQLRVAELAEALAGRGAQVVVTAEDDGPLRGRLEDAGLEVRLRPRVPTTDLDAYEAGVAAAGGEGRGCHDVVLGVGGTSFAAVEVADRWGLPALLRVGEAEPLPVVARWLGMPWSPELERRARRAFALADTVVTNSAAARSAYLAEGWLANYVVLSDGAELAAIDERVRRTGRAQARSRLGVGRDDVLVIVTGTLWPIKGQALLVDALARIAEEHPRVRLALVGQQEAGYVQGLRDLIAGHDLGNRVEIATFSRGMTTWYRAADVVGVPSVSESLPAVALEAMAHSVPVLATRVGELPALLEEGTTGWLCEPSDVDDLAAALRRAAGTGRAERRRMGRAARDRLTREHDSAVNLRRWCDLVFAAAERGTGRH
jgi:glycosyltransferase involved in cell wall biosynthesis